MGKTEQKTEKSYKWDFSHKDDRIASLKVWLINYMSLFEEIFDKKPELLSEQQYSDYKMAKQKWADVHQFEMSQMNHQNIDDFFVKK